MALNSRDYERICGWSDWTRFSGKCRKTQNCFDFRRWPWNIIILKLNLFIFAKIRENSFRFWFSISGTSRPRLEPPRVPPLNSGNKEWGGLSEADLTMGLSLQARLLVEDGQTKPRGPAAEEELLKPTWRGVKVVEPFEDFFLTVLSFLSWG